MPPFTTEMLAKFWKKFTPEEIHPWLDDMYAGVHVTPWAFAALASGGLAGDLRRS
jgi:hypothetical protein